MKAGKLARGKHLLWNLLGSFMEVNWSFKEDLSKLLPQFVTHDAEGICFLSRWFLYLRGRSV